mgnify:CR=1 FL=1
MFNKEFLSSIDLIELILQGADFQDYIGSPEVDTLTVRLPTEISNATSYVLTQVKEKDPENVYSHADILRFATKLGLMLFEEDEVFQKFNTLHELKMKAMKRANEKGDTRLIERINSIEENYMIPSIEKFWLSNMSRRYIYKPFPRSHVLIGEWSMKTLLPSSEIARIAITYGLSTVIIIPSIKRIRKVLENYYKKYEDLIYPYLEPYIND